MLHVAQGRGCETGLVFPKRHAVSVFARGELGFKIPKPAPANVVPLRLSEDAAAVCTFVAAGGASAQVRVCRAGGAGGEVPAARVPEGRVHAAALAPGAACLVLGRRWLVDSHLGVSKHVLVWGCGITALCLVFSKGALPHTCPPAGCLKVFGGVLLFFPRVTAPF